MIRKSIGSNQIEYAIASRTGRSKQEYEQPSDE
jgi:hypothetical protein